MNDSFEELIVKIKRENLPVDLTLIHRAFEFADKAHEGQKRLSGEDYIRHPLAVAIFLVEWKLDSASIAAGLLHDTIEDSGVTLEKIEKEFGKAVAGLVDGVTKIREIKLKESINNEIL